MKNMMKEISEGFVTDKKGKGIMTIMMKIMTIVTIVILMQKVVLDIRRGHRHRW